MKFTNMEKYLQSCKSEFWKKVFKAELDYIADYLKDVKNVLSVGCGPAIIETGLAEYGFNITGLDISKEALDQAPDNIRTVVGSAENMQLKNTFFHCAFSFPFPSYAISLCIAFLPCSISLCCCSLNFTLRFASAMNSLMAVFTSIIPLVAAYKYRPLAQKPW